MAIAKFQTNTNKWYMYEKPFLIHSGRITFVPMNSAAVYQFYADFYIYESPSNWYNLVCTNVTMDGPAGETVPTAKTSGSSEFILTPDGTFDYKKSSGIDPITIPAGATRGDVIASVWKVSHYTKQSSDPIPPAFKILYNPSSVPYGQTFRSIFGTSSFTSNYFYLVKPIKVNNNQIDTVYVNGTKLDSLHVNGVQYHENHVPNQ